MTSAITLLDRRCWFQRTTGSLVFAQQLPGVAVRSASGSSPGTGRYETRAWNSYSDACHTALRAIRNRAGSLEHYLQWRRCTTCIHLLPILASASPPAAGQGFGYLRIAIVVLLVAGWEWFIRERGLGDVAVANTAELWIQERARASEYGDEALILVGASRMQGGLDLDELRRASGLNPVQLAITGSPLLACPASPRGGSGDYRDDHVVSLDMAGLRVAEKDSDAEEWISAYDDFEAGRTGRLLPAESKTG